MSKERPWWGHPGAQDKRQGPCHRGPGPWGEHLATGTRADPWNERYLEPGGTQVVLLPGGHVPRRQGS